MSTLAGILFTYLSATLVSLIILYIWQHWRYYYLGFRLPGMSLLRNCYFLYTFCVIFGSMEKLPKKLIKFVEEERTMHPTMTKFWYGWKLMVIIFNPDLIKKIFHTHLHKDKSVYGMLEPLTNGPGLLHDNLLSRWNVNRKVITQASFTMSALKAHVKIFYDEANILAEKLGLEADKGRSVEPEHLVELASLSMVVRTMVGLDLKIQQTCVSKHPFGDAVHDALDVFIKRIVKQPWLLNGVLLKLSGNKKREINARRKARTIAEAIIARVKDKVLKENVKREETTREEEKSSRRDLNLHRNSTEERKLEQNGIQSNSNSGYLHGNFENTPENSKDCGNFTLGNPTAPLYNFVEVIIRDQLNPNICKKDVLSYDELVSEIIMMLFAGMDTTKTANVIVLIMLALHPTIQQEVYNEIQAVMGTDPMIAPTYDQLQELNVLTRVIKESLRLFPSGPIVGRTAADEFQVDGHTIPKGAAIWVTIFCGPHLDPRYWSNPDRFDPDRFLPSETQARNPNAYMPFSTGPRNCIGHKYAMLQMKTMISTILRRYRILPGEQCNRIEDIRWEFHITIKLLSGNDIRLEPR